MSYDIIVQKKNAEAGSASEAIEQLRALPAAGWLEITPLDRGPDLPDDLVVISLHGSLAPDLVGAAYHALVALARQNAYQLFDPQAGSHIPLDDPGTRPPGWVDQPELLTLDQTRELAIARRYGEIRQELWRIRDLNHADEHGLTALDHVLYSRNEGTSMKTGDREWKALQKLAIEMVRAGADPLQPHNDKCCGLLSAVKNDHSEVVAHIFSSMTKAERSEALQRKWDYETLLRHAEKQRVLSGRSDRTIKLLKKLITDSLPRFLWKMAGV